MDRIDFRSDTVTWPTPAMRQAMTDAPLGDDVYGEDPSINALEAEAAERLGKEAGLFVASGTMGNLAAILAHTGRGHEALVAADGHVMQWEAGAIATLGGVVPRALGTDADGKMDLGQLERSVCVDDPHLPRTRLVLLENTFGSRDGVPIEPDYFDGVRSFADRHQLSVHLDGARLFNAAAALGVPVTTLTRSVDSVSFCLSKGLCAPVGSVLCGDGAFIHEARRQRKALGGGMRQAGLLAAAGRVALAEMTERLTEDHRRARLLADGLAGIDGIVIKPERVRTNIVMFGLAAGAPLGRDALIERVAEESGILFGPEGDGFRAVTHYWLTDEHVDRLVAGIAACLR
ncbi:threonine aldolase [Acidobacteria bacterium Mor1]|nr:threonine aldolase [Acidobacteria bacterium Mor1]